MGASVATFASYFIVYAIRALTMKRFLPFNVYHGKLMINTVLLGAITSLMTYYGYSGKAWGLYVSIVALLVSVVFNGRGVFLACRQVLSSVRGRKRV